MRKYRIISIVISFILFSGVVLGLVTSNKNFQPRVTYTQQIEYLQTSAGTNFQIINDIFDNKAGSYDNDGFFPQLYETSLQGTYYGLSILDSISKLEVANKSKIIDYIMSHYNSTSGVFTDEYSSRYLGTDFSYTYYPLSTLLEVNAYALLSLSLLGSLNLIDGSKSINFLWSCYNPVSSGFIGQPYDPNLRDEFKISTMDNTYFAIITLDLLMASWSGNMNQKNELIAYINSLQNTNPIGWQYGGFYNDDNSSFNSLGLLFEPNMLSSYYCIKSLEVFGMESSINVVSFNQFLDSLYDSGVHYFRISKADFSNFTNVVATALGLELSQITNYLNINETEVSSFLYINRNSVGLWDGSTSIQKYELIDTFQILRSMFNAGKVGMFNNGDTQQMVNSLFSLFSDSEAFFLIPKEYNSLDLTHTMVQSFNLFDKVSDLDLLSLYSSITDSYYYDDYFLYDGFISYISEQGDNFHIGFRSYPIEFYSAGNEDYFSSIGTIMSHKATYKALDSLRMLFKLDDFGLTHDLSRLLTNIVDTQFLNPSYPDQDGAFLSLMEYNPSRAEFLSKSIHLEYSFYAIKIMELLTEYLGIGDITFINFDIGQFYEYLLGHTVETPEILYFQPSYTGNVDTIIRNTYYMVYILKSLDLYTLNSEKVEKFIEQNVDYTSIENVYYCYKIIELLDSELELSGNDLQGLIEDLYIPSLYDFYSSPTHTKINQEIFFWICDMTKSDLQIVAQYDENIILGNFFSLSASLFNLVLSDFEYNLSFRFECPQLGAPNIMDKEEENQFTLKVRIPQRSTNYPSIEGKLVAYDDTQKLVEKTISITTLYTQKYYQDDLNAAVVLSALFLIVPGGFVIISTKKTKKLR